MKAKCLILVAILLGASAYFYQQDATPEGEVGRTVTNMGWPLPWLEAVTNINGTTTYNVLWQGLIIDIAVYAAVLLLIFG